MNYADLISYVTGHLELDAVTAAQLPTFIALAESELDRALTVPQGETETYTSTVAGSQTLSLPADFQQMRSVLVDDEYPLAQVTLNVLLGNWAESSGKPQAYAIANQSLFFGPTPDAVYTITITYQAGLTGLSASNPSNWLLANYPDAYVYAVLIQAEAWLQNDKRLPLLQAKLDAVTESISQTGNAYRNSTPMRLRSPVVV